MNFNKYTREEEKSFKVGLVVSLVLIILMSFFFTQKSAVKLSKESDDYILFAKFGRSDGLSVGDEVVISGVKVGQVLKTDLDANYNSIVTMAIDDFKIPNDSSASIETSALLGSKFVSIEPGGDEEFLENGEYFEYTQDSIVIWELIDRVLDMSKNK